MAETINIYNFW